MENVTCDCGAVYREKRHRLPVRDKDTANCHLCGAEIRSWNGGVMYTYELIKNPKNASSDDVGEK
ncbi:hypothetical protein [Candidatus Halocynthiibacter alkanivorans]|uniref:hypothetical protein n=1 Tax=Candidatus Halocynthiibacter alkanivorans TaxID=2267619 RepID=UPI00109D63D3|nr:hypothetical protein [Candidatus Halocynthiibacter alkanivorans]